MRPNLDKTAGTNLRVVLYEGPGSSALEKKTRFDTLSSLLEDGFEVTRPTPEASVAQADASTLLVLGAFDNEQPPRAQGLTGETRLFFKNVTGLTSEGILEQAQLVRDEVGARKLANWKPWFPVIDYDRCTNCMQCLTFCLFDVYSVDAKDEITVQNESNCKTDCPACSRVCPEVAILFPKYKKGPINGAEVKAEDIQREAMKVDVSALLGGDIYASLRSRQSDARKRFSTERDESRALIERKKCLKKLQGDLDIPDEVLMTLPSAGDIEERAERAKEKMKKRMARSQTVADDHRKRPTDEEWGI